MDSLDPKNPLDPLEAALYFEQATVDVNYTQGYNDGMDDGCKEALEPGYAHGHKLTYEAGFYIGVAKAYLFLQDKKKINLSERTVSVLNIIYNLKDSFPLLNIIPPDNTKNTTNSNNYNNNNELDPVTALEKIRNRFRSIVSALKRSELESELNILSTQYPLEFIDPDSIIKNNITTTSVQNNVKLNF